VDCRTGKPFRELSRDEWLSSTPPEDFPCLKGDRDQEWWGQRASWGLMQFMGAGARGAGFIGGYLTELLSVPVNLEYGCRHMAGLAKRYLAEHGWAGVCRAYNGGHAGAVKHTNPEYAAKVLRALQTLGVADWSGLA